MTRSESDKFCLRWNDFCSNLGAALEEVREEKELYDVTVACEGGGEFPAHRLVLSACSLVICSPPRPMIIPTILSGTITCSLVTPPPPMPPSMLGNAALGKGRFESLGPPPPPPEKSLWSSRGRFSPPPPALFESPDGLIFAATLGKHNIIGEKITR